MCRAVLGIPGQQCTGRRPRTTDVTGESLTVDLRAVGATEEPRAEETPGQTSLKENTGREGREASEGRLRPGDREAGRLGGREAGRPGGWEAGRWLQTQARQRPETKVPLGIDVARGQSLHTLPAPPFPAGAADVTSPYCPEKQGREGGSTTGETESWGSSSQEQLSPRRP